MSDFADIVYSASLSLAAIIPVVIGFLVSYYQNLRSSDVGGWENTKWIRRFIGLEIILLYLVSIANLISMNLILSFPNEVNEYFQIPNLYHLLVFLMVIVVVALPVSVSFIIWGMLSRDAARNVKESSILYTKIFD